MLNNDWSLPPGHRSLTPKDFEYRKTEQEEARALLQRMARLEQYDPSGTCPEEVDPKAWESYRDACFTPAETEDGRRTTAWKNAMRGVHQRAYGGARPLKMREEPLPELEPDEEFEARWRQKLGEASRSFSLHVSPMQIWERLKEEYKQEKLARELVKLKRQREQEEEEAPYVQCRIIG